jgi:glyoxalase family protein
VNVSGIHHVTAISAAIQENLSFYTGTMGLRLVKKSVNQDDVSAYHLFYADAVGSPGTDLTFFDWPTTPPNQPGPGTVTLTTLRVAGSALPFWENRLAALNLPIERDEDAAGRARVRFSDPEGQALALVDDTGLRNEVTPWAGSVSEDVSIRGILGVDIESARPDSTRRVLTDLLGYEALDEHRFVVNTPTSASEVVVRDPSARYLGQAGAGGIHHVAFRVPDDNALLEFRDRIEAAGFRTSGYVDRFFFHSLYFRDPGGVLFELATDGPGMAGNEDPATLGEKLSLPPFLEAKRFAIESNLKPIGAPAYLNGVNAR